MSLTKLSENLNNHQSLPDQPALPSTQLKVLFDKAPNDIKTYLNTILTAEIDTLISNIQSGKIDVNKIVNDLTTGGSTNVASAETVKTLNTNKLGADENAVSASQLQTARNIALSGAVSGTASFDGSSNITIETSQANVFEVTGYPHYNSNFKYYWAEIDYPTGLNMANCIPIFVGFGIGDTDIYEWRFGSYKVSQEQKVGGYLSSAKIYCYLNYEPEFEDVLSCKVVLLKIS